MDKQTYYIVQTWRDLFIHKDERLGYVERFGIEKAAHLSLPEARRLYRKNKTVFAARFASMQTAPRRFPRILKVTIETKTITPRR